jgi:cell division protein FtsN
MRYLLVYFSFFILLSFSCRKKIAEDYIYYQPYKRDTVSVKKAITPSITTIDSLQTEEVAVDNIKPVDLNDKYFIVVASFSVEEYATAMKEEMVKQGFKPEILMLNDDGWHKLAICSYNSLTEATEAIEKLKRKGGLFSSSRIVIK